MNEIENLPDQTKTAVDDMQCIKGIGPSVAKALYELNIVTYQQLLEHPPEKLAELLHSKVAFISQQRIERDNWHGQAERLISDQKETENNTPQGKDSPRTEAQVLSESADRQRYLIKNRSDWHELADFFVSFGKIMEENGATHLQTKVHHSQEGKQKQWDGLALLELNQWMLEQVNLSTKENLENPKEGQDRPESDLNQAAKMSAHSTTIELSNLWVSQTKPEAAEVSGLSNQVIRVEGSFKIFGPQSYNLTYEREHFTIEIYLVNTETNLTQLISTYTGQLSPEKSDYPFQQDFPIPQRGVYQIFITGRILLPYLEATHLQGPILRVK